MSEFKVGDRVRVTRGSDYNGNVHVGRTGVVASIDDDMTGVDFGKEFEGHDLDGSLATDTGWFFDDYSDGAIELISPQAVKLGDTVTGESTYGVTVTGVVDMIDHFDRSLTYRISVDADTRYWLKTATVTLAGTPRYTPVVGDYVVGIGTFSGKERTGVVAAVYDSYIFIDDEDGDRTSIKREGVRLADRPVVAPVALPQVDRKHLVVYKAGSAHYIVATCDSRSVADDFAADFATRNPGSRYAVFAHVSTSVAEPGPVKVTTEAA